MGNSQEIFALALGLSSPWRVKATRFELQGDGSARVLCIDVDFEPGAVFSAGGHAGLKVYDTHPRSWRHLNFFQHHCYIHARVPRVLTPDGKVVTVEVPWARPGSGFTLLFEAYAMMLIESEMPVSKAADAVGENAHRIWRIFNYWISTAYSEAPHGGITRLGIDETSSRKGHQYITVGVDLDTARVVRATEGKDEACVTAIAQYLEQKGSPAAAVEQVCIDMSPAFISGCAKAFEGAAITFDKFHVVALLGKAMDELRRGERGEYAMLKGHRYLFLTADKNLRPWQRELRAELLSVMPKMAEGYRLKEMFNLFWEAEDKEEAEAFLAFWCDKAEESGIFPFIRFGRMLKAHWSGVVAWTKSRITNGLLEGINSKIQLAKRRARGYRNTENFINMIYFLCGKLQFKHPQYVA